MGSIGLVRKPGNDWSEIWGLSDDLFFKMLRLVLIVSPTMVQIGIVFTESVSKWLDDGMPRALELGHKEN
jgi:hypothetical protein